MTSSPTDLPYMNPVGIWSLYHWRYISELFDGRWNMAEIMAEALVSDHGDLHMAVLHCGTLAWMVNLVALAFDLPD
jgi:hypothetical protein